MHHFSHALFLNGCKRKLHSVTYFSQQIHTTFIYSKNMFVTFSFKKPKGIFLHNIYFVLDIRKNSLKW